MASDRMSAPRAAVCTAVYLGTAAALAWGLQNFPNTTLLASSVVVVYSGLRAPCQEVVSNGK